MTHRTQSDTRQSDNRHNRLILLANRPRAPLIAHQPEGDHPHASGRGRGASRRAERGGASPWPPARARRGGARFSLPRRARPSASEIFFLGREKIA